MANRENSIKEIKEFFQTFYPSGSEFSKAATEVAANFPSEVFSAEEIKSLLSDDAEDIETKYVVFIFAKAGHAEILPFARTLFDQSSKVVSKLEYAASLAQLGEESGYQYIEEIFQRLLKQDEDMKKFDFEEFVFIFDEILTNERGKDMIARFRKEADYDVVWEDYVDPNFKW